MHWWRRDAALQQTRADELIQYSRQHGFPFFVGLGQIHHAWARAAAGGDRAEVIAESEEGIALAAGTGNQGGAPIFLQFVAEIRAGAGQHAEALATVTAALDVSAQTGQHFCDAGLYRLKAQLVLAADSDHVEAENLLLRALDVAREQDAKQYELQAAASLARLWRDRGDLVRARALLAPVYAWFTEGFDTRDLQAAKALLDELE